MLHGITVECADQEIHHSGSNDPSTGEIVGAVFGVIIGMSILGFIVYKCVCMKLSQIENKNRSMNRQAAIESPVGNDQKDIILKDDENNANQEYDMNAVNLELVE